MGGQRNAPAALPPGKTGYLLYRRVGGPQSRPGMVRKISPPPGFDPRTVQPVASRYADYAIPNPRTYIYIYIYIYTAWFNRVCIQYQNFHTLGDCMHQNLHSLRNEYYYGSHITGDEKDTVASKHG
jgi:hypothetical protein